MIKFLIPLTSILWAAEFPNVGAAPYFPKSTEVLNALTAEQRGKIEVEEAKYLREQSRKKTEEFRESNFGTAAADPKAYRKKCKEFIKRK